MAEEVVGLTGEATMSVLLNGHGIELLSKHLCVYSD